MNKLLMHMMNAGDIDHRVLPGLPKAPKPKKLAYGGQPCYQCGGMYAEGGYYDCPDQEKDPVTGKCKAEVVRGKEATAANKAANADMNAWAKQVAAMDKENARQNAAQAAGQLSFDYDWMQSPVDKADKKAAMAQYKQFFQQNPNVFVPDDTSGYSPEQKYIIASKLKQRLSTPMGAQLAQKKLSVDPRYYDLQRMQSELAPKMGGWEGMRNFLFNVYKQNGGSTNQNAFTLPEVVVIGGKDKPTVNAYQKETDKLVYSDNDPYYGVDEYANHYAKTQIAKQYGVPKIRPSEAPSGIKSFMRNRSGITSSTNIPNPSYIPRTKTTYADFNDRYTQEYLPELSHYVSQNRQGFFDYNKGRLLDGLEYLKGNSPYKVKGTEENFAHEVIQPELTQAFMDKFEEGRAMAMSAAASAMERKKLEKKKQEGGPIVDPRGQWAHPGKVTRIPSSNITMQGVPYPVLGVASSGQQVMMQPGQNYNFGNAEYVDEYPMMQFGGGTLLGPMLPIMSKVVPKIAGMFSGDPLKKFIKWVNEPSGSTSRPSPLAVEAPVRTYGYLDTHSEYRDRANDVYSELKNNDTKEYNSPKQISLSSGRFRGATVDPEMINDIVNAAKANNVDPWVMLSLVGRESTFGSGASGNTLRAGNKQDLVSGWNVAEDYMPYEFNRFLADRQVPGVKVFKTNHGWSYDVKDKKAVDEYLKKNPQLIDSYYKKIESTPELGKLDSFTLAAQRIKKKGIQNYNPGDPKYSSMVNQDMDLLKQDAELKAYMKSKGYKEGGQLGSGLLSKSVTCSNCGWSWKAIDGGSEPMSCHKCGGTAKMQGGGIIPQYQVGGGSWVQKAANAEFSCAANPRSELRASAASVSGGSNDPLQDAKNNYWSRIKEDWQSQGVNKESFNNMYEDSLRAGPIFENPVSSQYFDPTTGKARPGTPGRLRYYKEAGYPLGVRPTLEQIKNTALEQPKGIKGYNKLVKEDYPWGVSPYIPTKLKDGGQPSLWDIIKMAQGGEMIRRADGSYSRRGLWDNIRANKGSGKKPTKQMLEQERKIKSKNK